MALINQNRSVLTILVATILTVFIATSAQAAKGGNGGGKPDGGSGGEGCTDEFPSFTYTKPGKRNSTTVELYVSSSEGCRTEKLADIDPGLSDNIAFSYSSGNGVVIWPEGENADLWVMRFTINNTTGELNTTPPVLALESKRSGPDDPTTEQFLTPDVWSDATTELAVVYSQLADWSAPQTVVRHRLLVVDLASSSCDSGHCATEPLSDWDRPESLSCISDINSAGIVFDPISRTDDWACLVPNGRPSFDITGSYIYYQIGTPGTYEYGDWNGLGRWTRPESGWFSTDDPIAELVFINADPISAPLRGQAINLDLDGDLKQVFASDACIGMNGGISDCRIYFLDVEACMSDLQAGWVQCQALYSGEVSGRRPSWRTDSAGDIEVVYLGWGSSDFETIRAFDPTLSPSDDNRQLISKGENPDSGL